MKRRHFVTTTALGSLAISSLTSLRQNPNRRITILHTNDTHSRIDPFPADDLNYPNGGGITARLKLVDAIRAEEKHVLLLDAGDIFQGTPYFNLYRGEVEMKAMSLMGYDAATMGNHDFDAGLEGFVTAQQFANFPFLCANYDFSDTPLFGKTQTNKIFAKGDLRIGIFGLGVELTGLVANKLFGNTQYLDPISKAQEQADYLKIDQRCDLVICLSHLGYSPKLKPMCDTVLAANTSNIDLIIGGHTHTFLLSPELHQNKKSKPVLINQVGWAGLVLGRIDFFFDEDDAFDDQGYFHTGQNFRIT